MIEAKDILTLCDRFNRYLIPLDIYVLRQRYNGKVLKNTYAVARDMGLAAETVRTIENRALEVLAHCLNLEANGQELVPMRLAKPIKQPVAGYICDGSHRDMLRIYRASRRIADPYGRRALWPRDAGRLLSRPSHGVLPA
jgi:hypothetical protein